MPASSHLFPNVFVNVFSSKFCMSQLRSPPAAPPPAAAAAAVLVAVPLFRAVPSEANFDWGARNLKLW